MHKAKDIDVRVVEFGAQANDGVEAKKNISIIDTGGEA